MNILELELLSDNIMQTDKFYRHTFGLKPVLADKAELIFNIGYTKLIFRESQNVKPVYHFAIDVPNNKFEEAYTAIKSKVPLLSVPPQGDIADFKNWDAKSFYFLDNNGNIVEVITRYANQTSFEASFNAEALLSISEIGLVTGSVPALAERIKHEFDVPLFHRQPAGERFTVCGDDEGLFILAEKGRDWFPTQIKSHSYRTRILFFHKGVIHHIAR